MGLNKTARAASAIACAVVLAACVLLLFTPFPRGAAAEDESYLCEWSDGSVSEESYASAFSAYVESDGEGALLVRGALSGKILFGEAFRKGYAVLNGGELANILALGTDGLLRLECAALFCAFSDTLFYDGGYFEWDGNGFVRTQARKARELCLLSGGLARGVLLKTGAEKLILRKGARISAEDFIGSSVREAEAAFPYSFENGAAYFYEAGNKRLAAGLPHVETIAVSSDTDYADEGALSPCSRLREVTLPFCGNGREKNGETYFGEFGYVFGRDEAGRYAVPETLARVTVTGGFLVSRAFYLCPYVREVNACGVPAEHISPDAFAGMNGLEYLHCPCADLALDGDFVAETLSCGCTAFRKAR